MNEYGKEQKENENVNLFICACLRSSGVPVQIGCVGVSFEVFVWLALVLDRKLLLVLVQKSATH